MDYNRSQYDPSRPPPIPPRPANWRPTISQQHIPPGQRGLQPHGPAHGQGYRSVLYFCNWAIYARKHKPKDIPFDHVSHILYAFCNVDAGSGEVRLSDTWSDLEICLDGNQSNQLKGCFGSLFTIKQKHRNLKLMLSIGGWTYSPALAQGCDSETKRLNFAKTSVKLLSELGLDGIDIDWEYPNDPQQAYEIVDLLYKVRIELDQFASSVGAPRDQFELSIAAPASLEKMQKLRIRDMDKYLSFWNVMCYDFGGSWSSKVEHLGNLYGGDISGDQALRYYMDNGVPANKLVMGMPAYGRAFANTNGFGQSFSGVGEGSWEQGCWDYKALPFRNSVEQYDPRLVAAYCYDPSSRVFVSYDNQECARAKASYVQQKRLGGGMWWESSGDFPISHPKSLVLNFVHTLGGSSAIDNSNNWLNYPESKYKNIREGPRNKQY